MSKISRKAFLRLTAAAAGTAALATRTSAQAATPAAMPKGPARTTLIKGADLLLMDPIGKEMKGADVILKDGKIAEIGMNLAAADAEVIEANGMILMPGMIDGHRHNWQTIDSGRVVKTRPTGPEGYDTYQHWKMRTIVCLTPEDNYLGEYVGGLMAIDSGVTAMLDYAHGQPTEDKAVAAAKGLKDSGIGGWWTFQMGVSSSYKAGDTVSLAQADSERVATATEAHWKTVARIQKELFSDSSSNLQFGIAPAGGTGRSMKAVKEEYDRARATGAKMIACHIHKPSKPFDAGIFGHKDSGVPDMKDAGLLGPDWHLSHANRLTAEELQMLKDTGGMIAATTVGEFPYMSSVHRGPSVHGRAREAGVAVGIGVDVSVALQQHDYFEQCRGAFWNLYLEPAGVKIASKYRSEDTLDFATALGAKAIRMGDVAGSITVGKRADLVLLRTDRIGFARQGTVADRVLNYATRSDVDSVWIGGVARKRNGAMIGVDWAKLKADIATAQDRFGPEAASITLVP